MSRKLKTIYSIKNILLLLIGITLLTCLQRRENTKYGKEATLVTTKLIDKVVCASDTMIYTNINNRDSLLSKLFPPFAQCKKLKHSFNFEEHFDNKGNVVSSNEIIHLDSIDISLVFRQLKSKERDIFVAGNRLEKFFIPFNGMKSLNNPIINYDEASFYALSQKFIISVVHPMNFCGLMSNFSLLQLIDIEKLKVYEFINFGDTPYFFISNRAVRFLEIRGEHYPNSGEWNTYISCYKLDSIIQGECLTIKKDKEEIREVKSIIIKVE